MADEPWSTATLWALHDEEEPTEQLRHQLLLDLGAERGLLGGGSIGRYHLEPDDARVHPCPWVGRCLGTLSFQLWDEGLEHDLLERLVFRGRADVIWRAPGAQPCALASVVERDLLLNGLLSKWGFEDGDVFLRRGDSPYLRDALHCMIVALEALEIAPLIGLIGTSHNPIRFNLFHIPEGGKGQPVLSSAWGGALTADALYERISGQIVRIWGFDVPGMERLIYGDD